MAWWQQIISYVRTTSLKDIKNEIKKEVLTGEHKHPKSFRELMADAFLEETLDWLYLWLGVFTYVYFFSVALLYLGALSNVESIASKIISALAEPYLGAVGIYTILKEARKRSRRLDSRHWGEFFVLGWLMLLVISSLFAFFFKAYTFNGTLEEIITISLAVTIIYIGGIIHKP